METAILIDNHCGRIQIAIHHREYVELLKDRRRGDQHRLRASPRSMRSVTGRPSAAGQQRTDGS